MPIILERLNHLQSITLKALGGLSPDPKRPLLSKAGVIGNDVSFTSASKLHSPSLSGSERGLGSVGDQPALKLRRCGHDVDCERVRLRKIHRHEINAILHQARDERHGTREPIKLGDHEGCTAQPALPKSTFEGGSVVASAAFHFLELGDEDAFANEPAHGLTLSLQAQAALTLSFSRDPIVGNEALRHHPYICFNGRCSKCNG